nr:MAG TPA: hypothetical protein [Caudoviricetes sp.]
MQASNLQSWSWQALFSTFKAYHTIALNYQKVFDMVAAQPELGYNDMKRLIISGDLAIANSMACWNEMERRRKMVGFCG